MRICTLISSYDGSTDPTCGLNPEADPARWLPEHKCEIHPIKKIIAVRSVRQLAQRNFDVFINLCDGTAEEDRAGPEVVRELERLGVAFTGAGSSFYEPSRENLKRVCQYAAVDTPDYLFVKDPADIAYAATNLRFPLIVKHPNSYNSIGLERASCVADAHALAQQVERMRRTYGGALIEEFISGREFSVLVAEPRDGDAQPEVYSPMEVLFPPGESFKHFDLKWRNYEFMQARPVEDSDLATRLCSLAQRVFSRFSASGYARLDIRADRDGRLYVLDINDNPSMFYAPEHFGSADTILSMDPRGHRGFLEHIIHCALRRQRRSARNWEVRRTPAGGYGIFATMDIAAGEMIFRYEERAHVLVSRSHVEKTWDPERLLEFRQYAWPLNEDTYVMWSDQPEDWAPINHCCDPNSWLSGLDVSARRRIRANEEITMEYATYCGELMEPFACDCKTALCRRVIRGVDSLEPWVTERYGEHVSDYVRQIQKKRRSDV